MGDLSRYADQEIIDIISSDAEAELIKRGYAYGWYKKDCFVGAIYILVNPAFLNLVKIGYADDVEKRLKSLNNSSGIPDPYHCYAIYKVKKRLEDLKLHGLIDSLDSDLRHAKNREFYEMSAEKAFSILSAIAQINGNEEQLILNPLNEPFFDDFNMKQNQKKEITSKSNIQNNGINNIIPDGLYYFERKKKSENNRLISVKALVKNGEWTLLKDSVLGIIEDKGVTSNTRIFRKSLPLDKNGKLLKDVPLGSCTPSHVGVLVMNQSVDGWVYWKNEKGKLIDIYRKK